ncbi:glutaredoxin [Psychrobacter frigidicola]|uniref:Glutaredoxin n=1 Tax=Psychrobacter frigidicola TaxID=45611 RepID=A0A5C7A399_9GAMM|nr:glutaredoxin domain-containing protein [Psychrobacter frigidicola]TXD97062.1 glutaredoxin [Psychrobacter frigidicola]
MLVKLIREGLGRLIAGISVLTQGKPMARTEEQQADVNVACENLSLYQFQSCPFCVKVRRQIHKLNLPIELRDAKNNEQFRNELADVGGRIKAPCLRIEQEGKSQWMYESNDINAYLQQRFG